MILNGCIRGSATPSSGGLRGVGAARGRRARRLALAFLIAASALPTLSACGKKPGDVLPPESVQDRDPFPRSYPAS